MIARGVSIPPHVFILSTAAFGLQGAHMSMGLQNYFYPQKAKQWP